MEPVDKTLLNEFSEILKRRIWSLILPATLIFVICAAVAFILPPVYKSTSTILIEEQGIPRDFVMTAVTSYAEQRLQTINQRIMSGSKLLEIINQFNLYADQRDKRTTEEIIGNMRDDIKLDTISADVIDRRTGRPTVATIAFTLSYEGENPDIVQQVANVLTSLYLKGNIRIREQQALGTSEFLEDEMNEVKESLGKIETRIASFKEKHINELPELLQVNMQGVDRVERDIERLNDQLRTLKEREGYLQTQLASVSPDAINDKTLLKNLKAQLVELKSRFSDEYPDVIKIKSQIEALEKRLRKTPSQGGEALAADQPDNPAYITLASQLTSTQSEIDSVTRQTRGLYKKVDDYRHRIEATPSVEKAYKALMGERNNTQAKYDDLMRKFMEAKVAQGLEKGQMGERFTLIDPARLPEKPVRPNRLAILLIGMVLGIGAGAGMVLFKESTDSSVRSAESLARATGFPVLTGLPEIITRKDRQRIRLKRVAIIAGVILIIVAGLLAFHFFVMDFNVFWAKVMRRMGI